MRYLLLLLTVCVVCACAKRGDLGFGSPGAGGDVRTIWLADFRSSEPRRKRENPPRPKTVSFGALDVSVPRGHAPGVIEWPKGKPDPARDFVTVGSRQLSDMDAFAQAVARSDTSPERETMVFVHGYNVTEGEAVYQLAQIAHDFDIPGPTVLFSWPSAAIGTGYLYDRDSVLLSRDRLEALIVALTRDPNRKLLLVGHSMGSLLVMETLRQMALAHSLDIAGRINGIILMSPDIDADVFQDQARRIGALPDPFLIFAAKDDKALRLSAFLTGRKTRLGLQTDRASVGDLPISVIDVSAFESEKGLNHSVATSSPTAIDVLKRMIGSGTPGDLEFARLVVLGKTDPVAPAAMLHSDK